MQIQALVIFHFIFFWEVYRNPFVWATSELISTFFPSWVWMGRQVRQMRSWKTEPFYWLNFHSHSLLSPYYPPSVLAAYIASHMKLDGAFRLKVHLMLGHFLLQSLLWYGLLAPILGPDIALFGAMTFTYCAVNIRLSPYIIYTLTWFPLCLYDGWISAIGVGMMLLSGYYPYALYLLPLAFVLNPVSMLGVVLGLPQLIPFFKYMPKTVKWAKAVPLKCGYWEYQWYFGITPLIFLCNLKVALLIIMAVLAWWAVKDWLPRVPERAMIVLTYILAYSSLCWLKGPILALTILQAFDLWFHNHRLIPTRPYTELQRRPKWCYDTPQTRFLKENAKGYRVSGLSFPNTTGHISEIMTLGYCGGMANRMMAKWRNEQDPNGSGMYDWFQYNKDSHELDTFRVKFAISRKSNGWFSTECKHLWQNPRISPNTN